MKIIICGAGLVGLSIARKLATEKNDVTVIDSKKELINKISNTSQIQTVLGFGSSPSSLEMAGASDADMLIAVTHQDEINMMACQVAHSLFSVPYKIARIRNQDYLSEKYKELFSKENMPIDIVISPEIEVARSIYLRLYYPGTFQVLEYIDNKIIVLAMVCNAECSILNTSLKHLSELFPDLSSTIMAIERDEKIIIPHGQDQIFEGDAVYIATTQDCLHRIFQLFGEVRSRPKQVIIAGGGNIGFNLAQNLEQMGNIQIKIIENDKERAIQVSEKLNKTIVFHGNTLEKELLLDADIENTDAFLALTNNDHINILSVELAKKISKAECISLVNDENLFNLFSQEEHKNLIDPRGVTISRILTSLHKGRIHSAHSVKYGQAEILQAQVPKASVLCSSPLSDVIPNGIRIGAVMRKNTVIFPKKNFQLEMDDEVILISSSENLEVVDSLFSVRSDFF